MSGRGNRRTRVVAIHPRFEPSRVAVACVVDAYERLVPLRQRTMRTAFQPQPTAAASQMHQERQVAP